MPFHLSEASLDRDWPDLFACEWTAWSTPPQSIWQLSFPIPGSGPSAEADAVELGSARQLKALRADPQFRWVKVVDGDKDGIIVAAALWRFHDENPYRAPPAEREEAVWLPEGRLRELYAEMARATAVWRVRVGCVAHAHLINLFTHPDYRNRGLGGRLVEWGLREADEKGLEAYVEGTFLGRGLYERYGFVVMHLAEMEFGNEHGDEEWVRLVKQLRENPIAIMWRPAGGKYVNGETVVPWEGAPRKE